MARIERNGGECVPVDENPGAEAKAPGVRGTQLQVGPTTWNRKHGRLRF